MNPTLLGAIAAVVSAVGIVYTTWSSRRTERRSATREETQQALTAQTQLLDRYEARIERLEDSVKTSLAREALCERRLAHAEDQIVMLGGKRPLWTDQL